MTRGSREATAVDVGGVRYLAVPSGVMSPADRVRAARLVARAHSYYEDGSRTDVGRVALLRVALTTARWLLRPAARAWTYTRADL